MTGLRLDHLGPWTEEEYLALNETPNRIELIDGGPWVSPGPTVPHQGVLGVLHEKLKPAARNADLSAFEGITLRAGRDRLLIPDLAVINPAARLATVVDATEVALVVEIVSPSSKTMDRLQKRAMYEAAKIPVYLLVEPDPARHEEVTLHLFRLQKNRYVEAATAKQGDTLVFDEPFPIELSTNDLIAF